MATVTELADVHSRTTTDVFSVVKMDNVVFVIVLCHKIKPFYAICLQKYKKKCAFANICEEKLHARAFFSQKTPVASQSRELLKKIIHSFT